MDHAHAHTRFTHDHVFLGHGHEKSEARARLVTLLTALFMVVEIVAGLWFGSMALLADGVHMATHVGALGLAAGAYWLARRHAADSRFSFGSGKFGDLAAFASAIVLGLLSLGVAVESVRRVMQPVTVEYGEALVIAVIGLLVNIASAAILHEGHDHHHDHEHGHDHDHLHRDNNLRAAYVHVLADAATSVLAIVALAAGMVFGIAWPDPVVGIVGAVMIALWAVGLIRDSALVLLDAVDDPDMASDIRATVEHELHGKVFDLHLWRLGPGHHGLIVSFAGEAADGERLKALLTRRYPSLSHVTVELAVCADCARQP
ncbi:CDF family Co(II)/Ni(II) efflux transporter DmeF [Rhizomicrobium electricum]|uniref:CDF family Co(II)/Ni(II) efflux transporter DmeF n=1 Tax=Rhizomicrobium electricum TaxID=480070 RepID=A0ABP3PU23_9PROT|nr:CDF family Co(II)/Ni(II) efflux transporter DmeF [Rhizomicrobium electricum]NIJ49508.1 cation diffusion facilitator family transporter [Rhizomicrobium electricum]